MGAYGDRMVKIARQGGQNYRKPPNPTPYWETEEYKESGTISHLLLTDLGFRCELKNRLRESRDEVLRVLGDLGIEVAS